MEVGVPLRSDMLPWSRILDTWADRLGFVGKGGGGIWLGWVSRLRWVADNAVRWGSRWASGEDTDLEVESKVRGRRVNVGSIAATIGLGWMVAQAIEEMICLLNTLFWLSIRYATLEYISLCVVLVFQSFAPLKPHLNYGSTMREAMCQK